MQTWSLALQRRFGPILYIQTLAGFSNNFFKTATFVAVTYVFYPGDARLAGTVTALAAATSALPHFLFASIAGQLGDRMDKARLARFIRGADVFLMLGAAVALRSNLTVALLLVVFLAGTRATFYSPLRYSMLPRLLDRSQLLFATGIMQAAIVVAAFAGQVAGGLIDPFSAGLILVSISIACFLASLFIPSVPSEDPTVVVDWKIFRGLYGMLRGALALPTLRTAILGISAIDACGAVLLSQFAPLVRHTMGGSPAVVSLFFGAFAVGTAIGAVAVGRILKGEISTRLAPWTLVAMGLITSGLWLTAVSTQRVGETVGIASFLAWPASWGMLLLAVALAACVSVLGVPLYGILQTAGLATERNRYVAANNVLNALAILLATGSVGLCLKAGFVPVDILLFFAVAILAIGIALAGRRNGRAILEEA
jgi:acyl-[acyl-carrier-protein]-phospholipid O-acyltransferase/long-chain-fatty-acid--[acyl-carrier-protein] ligase